MLGLPLLASDLASPWTLRLLPPPSAEVPVVGCAAESWEATAATATAAGSLLSAAGPRAVPPAGSFLLRAQQHRPSVGRLFEQQFDRSRLVVHFVSHALIKQQQRRSKEARTNIVNIGSGLARTDWPQRYTNSSARPLAARGASARHQWPSGRPKFNRRTRRARESRSLKPQPARNAQSAKPAGRPSSRSNKSKSESNWPDPSGLREMACRCSCNSHKFARSRLRRASSERASKGRALARPTACLVAVCF